MSTSRAAALLDSLCDREAEFAEPSRRSLFDRAEPLRRSLFDRNNPLAARLAGRGRLAIVLAGCLGIIVVTFAFKFVSRPPALDEQVSQLGDADVASVDSMLAASISSGSESAGTEAAPEAGGATADSELSAGPEGRGTKSGGVLADGESGSVPEKGSSGVGANPIVVHVAGAVASPGVVELPTNGRVVDAIAAAGGLRQDADPDRLNLAAGLSDGTRVFVPIKGVDPAPELALGTPPSGPPSGSASTKAAGTQGAVAASAAPAPTKVNINTASAEELQKLPGVGPATSAAIVAKRDKDGPFKSVEGLLEVRGIGDTKLEAIRDLATVK